VADAATAIRAAGAAGEAAETFPVDGLVTTASLTAADPTAAQGRYVVATAAPEEAEETGAALTNIVSL
jgi:hypothetical protein